MTDKPINPEWRSATHDIDFTQQKPIRVGPPPKLYFEDGRFAGIYACSQCGSVNGTEYAASLCCNRICECGAPLKIKGWASCEDCIRKRRDKEERDTFEKAEKLRVYSGMVYHEGAYYPSVDDLCDSLLGIGEEVPRYAWACTAEPFVKVDVDRILERIEEDGYEDFDSSGLIGLGEFRAAAALFEKLNKDVVAYWPDYSRVVLIPAPGCAEGCND